MIKKCLSSNNAPEAIGPYSSALKICDYVYLSGQLPVDPSTNQIVDGGVYEQTVQCLKNLNAILDEVDLDVNYLVNVRVYLTDMQDYDKMNEAYSSMFKEPYPSRVVVGVTVRRICSQSHDHRNLNILVILSLHLHDNLGSLANHVFRTAFQTKYQIHAIHCRTI